MSSTVWFGSKSSCCNSTDNSTDQSESSAQLDSSELSATSSARNSCCSISSTVSREDIIREKAYSLWEEAGRPECDGAEFWIEAEKQLAAI